MRVLGSQRLLTSLCPNNECRKRKPRRLPCPKARNQVLERNVYFTHLFIYSFHIHIYLNICYVLGMLLGAGILAERKNTAPPPPRNVQFHEEHGEGIR
jgi:hypothetical protein